MDAIVRELDIALATAGMPARPQLLGIVASWRDTMDDGEALDMLKAWNGIAVMKGSTQP